MSHYRTPCLLLLFWMASSVGAQVSVVNGFENIVIGTGCASTCVNGKCKRTCKSEGDLPEQGSLVVTNESDSLIQKEYDLRDFRDIVVDGFSATISEGKEHKVSLIAAPRDIDDVGVVLVSKPGQPSTLKISSTTEGLSTQRGHIMIQIPTLNSMRAYGNSDVQIQGFAGREINLEASSNTDISVVDSQFESLLLRVDGNAGVDLTKSKVLRADVSLTDQANAKIHFAESETGLLSGTVAGMSDLAFCGTPDQSLKVSETADATEIECHR